MVEIGIRELKSRLSYYVQLMQAGETVAIKVRNRVVGFLSNILPQPSSIPTHRGGSRKDVALLLRQWKKEGLLVTGGLYSPFSFKPVHFKGNLTATEIIHKIRDTEP